MFVCFVLFARFVIVNLRRLSSLSHLHSSIPMTSSLSWHLPSLVMAPHLLIVVFHIPVGLRPLSLSRFPRFSSSLTYLLYSLAYLFASSTFHRIPYSSHPQGPFCCLFVIFFLTWRDRISMVVWVVCLFLSTSHILYLPLFVLHTLYLSLLPPLPLPLPLPLHF